MTVPKAFLVDATVTQCELKGKGLKQQGDATVFLGPWNEAGLCAALLAGTAGKASSQSRLRMHCIQMSGASLTQMFLHRTLGQILRVRHTGADESILFIKEVHQL